MVTEAESGRIQRLFLFSGNLLPARIWADARFLIVRATPRTLSSFFSSLNLSDSRGCARPSWQASLSPSVVQKDRPEGQRGGIVPPRLRWELRDYKAAIYDAVYVTRVRGLILLQITHRFFSNVETIAVIRETFRHAGLNPCLITLCHIILTLTSIFYIVNL